ncbi:MAG: hypothetical protein ACRYF3_04485 [Janthinobacterium lividum]
MRQHDAETDLDDLDAFLRSAAPQLLPPQQQDEVFADTWRTITTTVSTTPQHTNDLANRRSRRLDVVSHQQTRARRHRRITRASAITLTVALAGTGTAAAATYLASHTGQQTSGWQVAAAGPGEILRQNGSDYLDVARQLTTDIPFAPDHQVQRVAQFRTGFLAVGADTSITVSALRAQVAQNAICTWADAWITADTTGNAAAREVASDTLARSLTWTAVSDVDPVPSKTGDPGDAGAETVTRFGWVPAIASAASTGDRAAVVSAVTDSGRCSPDLTPSITTALTTTATVDPAAHGTAR